MKAGDALRNLRRCAADRTLFEPTSLRSAIARLGFVQADPIRAPARAQDLILRHRVVDYRAGDLERAYPSLPVVEDTVHVYGFLHRGLRPLLHPRRIARRFRVEDEHPHLRRAILDHLERSGESHPRAVEQAIAARHPRAAIINAWGGQSNAATNMLDILHYRGLLHVTRRVAGIRVYALGEPIVPAERLSPRTRADGLIELLVRLYAPLPRASLTQLTLMLGERAMPRDALRARIPLLLRRGVLRGMRVDGVDYLLVADDSAAARAEPGDRLPRVRFLAPFDPLVWDRRRFEHLWGWSYRFEAYTPLARRRLGYYALPLLWEADDDARLIGWVNVKRIATASKCSRRGGVIDVAAGYVDRKPAARAFDIAFDAEVARLERFLAAEEPAAEAPDG